VDSLIEIIFAKDEIEREGFNEYGVPSRFFLNGFYELNGLGAMKSSTVGLLMCALAPN